VVGWHVYLLAHRCWRAHQRVWHRRSGHRAILLDRGIRSM